MPEAWEAASMIPRSRRFACAIAVGMVFAALQIKLPLYKQLPLALLPLDLSEFMRARAAIDGEQKRVVRRGRGPQDQLPTFR